MHVPNRQKMERGRLALQKMRLQVRGRSIHTADEARRDRRASHKGSDEPVNIVNRARQPPRRRQSRSHSGTPDQKDEGKKKEGSGS